MERIASFCVDHTTLLPGMYLSRRDGANGEILTWDVRMMICVWLISTKRRIKKPLMNTMR